MIALCWVVYFFSYLAKANYNAAVGNIILTEGFTKTAASLATTGCFFSYGVGQLIFGFWGDRGNPRTMISTGLLVASFCNLLVPLFPNVAFITAIWCVNGLAQAMLWPPLVRILSECLNERDFKRPAPMPPSLDSPAQSQFISWSPFVSLFPAGNWPFS